MRKFGLPLNIIKRVYVPSIIVKCTVNQCHNFVSFISIFDVVTIVIGSDSILTERLCFLKVKTATLPNHQFNVVTEKSQQIFYTMYTI